LAETINGLYKAEVIHRRGPWRSFEAVEFAPLRRLPQPASQARVPSLLRPRRVDWFNHRRLLESIGNMPPAEAEARYYAELETLAMAA